MLEQPWKRSKNPAQLPDFDQVDELRHLAGPEFSEILRDHLEPASNDANYVSQWRRFWNHLAFDEQLADRTESVLEDFIDRTAVALEAGAFEAQEAKRATRFRDRCLKALDRLDRADVDPLGWLGARAAGFNPRSRGVIAALIDAIDDHRRGTGADATPADKRLWAVLRAQRIDPKDHRDH